jgi:hypothetical protein
MMTLAVGNKMRKGGKEFTHIFTPSQVFDIIQKGPGCIRDVSQVLSG